MATPDRILDRLLLVGGPPRSGTSFAAGALNAHPRIVTAIDDHVYECWGLYHYRDRSGLIHELRTRPVSREEARMILAGHLFADGRLQGAAPSGKTVRYPKVSGRSPRFRDSLRSVLDHDLARHEIPLEQFSSEWRLCLKSPEISFVLPQLAGYFPDAKFVLVHRPVVEIAESMFRLGNKVERFPVFHRRWSEEKGKEGEWIPPAGIPAGWRALWDRATGFQRCVIYAASYVKAVIGGCALLPGDRFFVYDHARLRGQSEPIMHGLASFLGVDRSGFGDVAAGLRKEVPALASELAGPYDEMREKLDLDELARAIETLGERALSHNVTGGPGQ